MRLCKFTYDALKPARVIRPNGRCELEKETRACGVVSRRKLSSRMQKSIAITIHDRQAGRWNIWCSLVETERIAQPDIVEGRVLVARRRRCAG